MIREDPQIEKLARRRAGDPDIAEDALQEAFYAIAKMENPGQIRNLEAYFRRVLTNEIYHLLGQPKATLVENIDDVPEARPGGVNGRPRLPSPEEDVGGRLTVRSWKTRLAAQHAELIRKVPGRSPDPGRYRNMILTFAERMLMSWSAEDVSDSEYKAALRAHYPEWFAERGCTVDNVDQRLSRARADVNSVLRLIVHRDELYP
jgi:hypothetical protein